MRAATSKVGILEDLDAGEREAIFLAEEMRASLLLIDEKQGRLEAKRRSISTIGTLGVLLAGAKKGLADPELLFQRLIAELHFGLPLRSGNVFFSTAKNWPSSVSLIGDSKSNGRSQKTGLCKLRAWSRALPRESKQFCRNCRRVDW